MIADHYLQLRSELENALTGLLDLGSEMPRASSALDTIHTLLKEIRSDLFLVVVTGEAKSGKSSLLNALFGQEFINANALPATNRICILRHGDEKKTVEVSPQLLECHLPIPSLRDFTVVDTPGTTMTVEAQEVITKDFVPRADLVLFVFSAAHPWTQSAWDYLGLVQERALKNFVFVLQQIDLREPTEIEIIRRHLQDTTMRRLGFAPPIFPVSARKALLARTTGVDKERLWRESNFDPLEEQINLIATQPSTRMSKFRSTCQTARVTLAEFDSQFRESVNVIAQDEARLAHIQVLLQKRKDQSLRRIRGLLGGVEQACRDAASHGAKLFQKRLSLWRTWGLAWNRGSGRAIFNWISRQA